MRPAENIKRRVKNAIIIINPEIKKTALKELIDELEKPKMIRSAGTKPNMWRIIMKSRITKIAAAMIILVIIVLHQFNSSINGTSIVWADVAERLEKVSSYKAQARRVLTEVGQEEPFFECEILRYFSPDHGSVEESYDDGKLVMLAYC